MPKNWMDEGDSEFQSVAIDHKAFSGGGGEELAVITMAKLFPMETPKASVSTSYDILQISYRDDFEGIKAVMLTRELAFNIKYHFILLKRSLLDSTAA